MSPAAHAALVISVFASVLGALVMCGIAIRYGLGAADETDGGATRLFVTRFGHAVAGVCFAATGIMAVVVLAAPRPAPPAPAVVAREPDRAAEARLQTVTDDVKALAERLDQRLEQLDRRVGVVDGRVNGVDSSARRLGDELEVLSVRTRQMERAMAAPPRRAAAAEPPARPVPAKEIAREPVAAREVVKDAPRVTERFVPASPTPAAPGTPTAPPAAATADPAAAVRPPSPAAAAEKTTPPVVRAPEPASAPHPLPTPATSRPLPSSARAQDPVAATPRSADGSAAAAKSDADLKDKFREDWKAIRGGFATAGDDFKNAVRDLRQKLWP